MRKDVEQRVTSTCSLEGPASDNLEASFPHNCFNISLQPTLSRLRIGLLASIYVLDIVATLFLIPGLKGKPLE